MIRGIRKAVDFIPAKAPFEELDPRSVNSHLRRDLARKARDLRSSMLRRVKVIRDRAFKTGYADGLKNAEINHQEKQTQILAETRHLLTHLRNEAIEAGFLIAERILERHLKRDSSFIARNISREIDSLLSHAGITITTHSSELSKVQSLIKESSAFRWESSKDIPRGSARILTPYGELLIDWKESIKNIYNMLQLRTKR